MQDLAEKSNIDYIYYNCILHNNTNDDIQCSFNETRSTPYINNIEDYELAVIRFKICAFLLPLFTFEEGEYSVMMTYQHALHGVISSVVHNVECISSSFNNASLDVYDYKDFINMVNMALHDAYADLRNAVFVMDNAISLENLTSEPVITYDP